MGRYSRDEGKAKDLIERMMQDTDDPNVKEADLRPEDRLLVRSRTRLVAYGARLSHRVESHAGTLTRV